MKSKRRVSNATPLKRIQSLKTMNPPSGKGYDGYIRSNMPPESIMVKT